MPSEADGSRLLQPQDHNCCSSFQGVIVAGILSTGSKTLTLCGRTTNLPVALFSDGSPVSITPSRVCVCSLNLRQHGQVEQCCAPPHSLFSEVCEITLKITPTIFVTRVTRVS